VTSSFQQIPTLTAQSKLNRANSFSSQKDALGQFQSIVFSASSCDSEKAKEDIENSNETQAKWAKYALFISSFGEGVENSPDAQEFLKSRIIYSMVAKHIKSKETSLKESVIASPCNGPDIDKMIELEEADKEFQKETSDANEMLAKLKAEYEIQKSSALDLRVLYIPTAMYALRADSANSPGKQRQRARADGKKRRTIVLKTLEQLFDQVNVLGVTLDLDDGSIKQPTGSDDLNKFPSDGLEAFQSWDPHLVYVEGGNTFWLKHCIDKGNWGQIIQNACTGNDAAVYCGKSAGAIVGGKLVETATWKGWDDPSVVEEKSSYEEWKDVKGFEFIGETSIFPHMDDKWEDLVKEKKINKKYEQVLPLREWEAFCIDGDSKATFLYKGVH